MLVFSSFECALVAVRHKEDHFNPIISGFMTSAVLAVRQGPKSMLKQGIAGGVVLAVFEGVAILIDRSLSLFAKPQQPQLPMAGAPAP